MSLCPCSSPTVASALCPSEAAADGMWPPEFLGSTHICSCGDRGIKYNTKVWALNRNSSFSTCPFPGAQACHLWRCPLLTSRSSFNASSSPFLSCRNTRSPLCTVQAETCCGEEGWREVDLWWPCQDAPSQGNRSLNGLDQVDYTLKRLRHTCMRYSCLCEGMRFS